MADYLETNELLDSVENSNEYIQYNNDIKKALNEQWSDLVYSGIIITILNGLFQGDNVELPKTKKGLDLLKVVIKQKTEKAINSLNSYNDIKLKTTAFLKYISERGGQDELEHYLGDTEETFRLTNTEYNKKITDRTNTLLKGLTIYTITRFVNETVKAMGKYNNKELIISEVSKVGKDIARKRSDKISISETASGLAFMQIEFGRMNGAEKKIWKAIVDEKICPICNNLHNQIAPIGGVFAGGFYGPVAHTACRCSVEVIYENVFVEKSYQFYNNDKPKDILILSIPNREYRWIGGNNYKGKDVKNMKVAYEGLIIYTSDEIRNYFDKDFKPTTYKDLKMESKILEAKELLTYLGYRQLMYNLANREGQVGRKFINNIK